jgi:(S)-2-hydroxyglutarate dehydrogenase
MPPVQRGFRVTTDILVIGGGIVGLSTAMQLTERYADVSVTVIEKETTLASHQTGHNSGVIHAGVYYPPGSLKARFCREGSAATYAFCRNHGLAVEQCGKLIVATNPLEELRLEDLLARCRSNGLAPQWIDAHELRRIEPHIVGRAAILVSTSGIADYPAIARKMAAIVEQRGGKVLLDSPVTALRESRDEVIADTPRFTLRAQFAIVCAGLMADRLAGMCGIPLDFKIVPFRGEYFRLPEAMNGIVSRLIYPVPNPELPFLGVHLTRMIGGYVTVGPNAVLALAREGYRWRDVNPRDLLEMAMFPGLRNMLRRHGRSAIREFANSVFKRGYLSQCTKYCPELTLDHLEPHPAGVRAQAVQADGTMIHDFLIKRSRRSLHVCNAPSPAATAALPIGRHLIDRFSEEFSFPAASSP